jgi:hypothetical protein
MPDVNMAISQKLGTVEKTVNTRNVFLGETNLPSIYFEN